MSYAGDVEDEGEPNQSLDIAGQALLDFLERAPGLMSVDQPGWRYAPDAYRSLGELKYLAALLPEVMQRIVAALQHEVELNLIRIDPGTEYEDRPEAAVEAAVGALDGAVVAALVVAQSVADAQNAIARAAYAGPDSDLHDGPPRVTVWSSPAAPGEARHHGLVGTTYSASCTCGWPPLPAMVDRQTSGEAEAEAQQHAAETRHLYEPPARW
jgi:hypothetical protein